MEKILLPVQVIGFYSRPPRHAGVYLPLCEAEGQVFFGRAVENSFEVRGETRSRTWMVTQARAGCVTLLKRPVTILGDVVVLYVSPLLRRFFDPDFDFIHVQGFAKGLVLVVRLTDLHRMLWGAVLSAGQVKETLLKELWAIHIACNCLLRGSESVDPVLRNMAERALSKKDLAELDGLIRRNTAHLNVSLPVDTSSRLGA